MRCEAFACGLLCVFGSLLERESEDSQDEFKSAVGPQRVFLTYVI